MTGVNSVPAPDWIDRMDQRIQRFEDCIHRMQDKVVGLCGDDENKLYSLYLVGRGCEVAASAGVVISALGLVLTGGHVIAIATLVSSVAFGILGVFVVEGEHGIKAALQGEPDLPPPQAFYPDKFREMPPLRPSVARFVSGQPVGLKNSGNNCWINAGLQLIINSPDLLERARAQEEVKLFLDRYHTVLATQEDRQRGEEIDLGRELRRWVRQYNPFVGQERVTSQEDPSELLEVLFEGVNSPHAGLVQSTRNVSNRESRDTLLSIDIRAVVDGDSTFQRAFDEFFHRRTDRGVYQSFSFFGGPPLGLTVKAARFDANRRKIAGGLPGCDQLVLSGANIQVDDHPDVNYSCDGFIVHKGNTLLGGHYIAYVLKGGQWWCCNDSRISLVSNHEAVRVMEKEGYIFHYSQTT